MTTAEPFDYTAWTLAAEVNVVADLDAHLGAPMLPEAQRRRTGWTQGLPVRGTDGQLWYFPALDLALAATVPGLIDEVRALYRMAHDWSLIPEGEPGKFMAKLQHDMALIRLACRLLTVNYSWDDRVEVIPDPPIPEVPCFAGVNRDDWVFAGMFPPQLLNHRGDNMACIVVMGQAGRAVDQVAKLIPLIVTTFYGSPSLN